MAEAVHVVCSACKQAVALAWDDACLVPAPCPVDLEPEAVEALCRSGPTAQDDLPPLAAGAWTAALLAAAPFARAHVAHGALRLARAPDPGVEVVAPPPGSPDQDPRLGRARALGPAGVLAGGPDGLALAAFLPLDGLAALEARLLDLSVDPGLGRVAERALATLVVRAETDPAARRERLGALAAAAFAREAVARPKVVSVYEEAAARLGGLDALRVRAVERLAAGGRVDDALALAARFALPAERLGAVRARLGAAIADASRPAADRVRAAWKAAERFPGLVAEVRRGLAGALPDAGEWAGRRGVLAEDAARTLAALTLGPGALEAAFEAAEPLRLQLALELVDELVPYDPAGALALEPRVRRLLRDGRSPPGATARRLCSSALELHARLLRACGAVAPGEGRAWELLAEAVDAALAMGLGQGLRFHLRALVAAGVPAERVGERLLERLADGSRKVPERLQAREALAVLAAEGGAVVHNKALPSPEGARAAARADDLLVAWLQDPASPGELTKAIRAGLTRWMPGRVAELQASALQAVAVPSVLDLARGSPPVTSLRTDEVRALIEDPQAEVGRALGALALVEAVAKQLPATRVGLEAALRGRVADERRLDVHGRTRVVGEEALRAHREVWRLLAPGERPPAAALVAAVLAAVGAQATAPAEDLDGCRGHGLLVTVREACGPADLDGLAVALLALVAERARPGPVRLHARRALEAIGRAGPADAVLLWVLGDPTADAWLREAALPLVAASRPAEVRALQAEGRAPRPALPPVEALVRVYYDRDPRGEREPAGDRIARAAAVTFPDDVLAHLRAPEKDPARACAAALVAPRVARGAPALAAALAEALRACEGLTLVHRAVLVRPHEEVFSLAEEAARARKALAAATAG